MSDVRRVSVVAAVSMSAGGPAGAAAVAGLTGLGSVLYSVTGFTLIKRVLDISSGS